MISTETLLHHIDTKTLSCELSDINLQEGITREESATFMWLKSHKTGSVSIWELVNVNIDHRESELQSWEFEPNALTLFHFPQLVGYKLIVFND